jgi:hypothetical protein
MMTRHYSGTDTERNGFDGSVPVLQRDAVAGQTVSHCPVGCRHLPSDRLFAPEIYMTGNLRRKNLISQHTQTALIYKDMLGVDEAMAYLARSGVSLDIVERVVLTG